MAWILDACVPAFALHTLGTGWREAQVRACTQSGGSAFGGIGMRKCVLWQRGAEPHALAAEVDLLAWPGMAGVWGAVTHCMSHSARATELQQACMCCRERRMS